MNRTASVPRQQTPRIVVIHEVICSVKRFDSDKAAVVEEPPSTKADRGAAGQRCQALKMSAWIGVLRVRVRGCCDSQCDEGSGERTRWQRDANNEPPVRDLVGNRELAKRNEIARPEWQRPPAHLRLIADCPKLFHSIPLLP